MRKKTNRERKRGDRRQELKSIIKSYIFDDGAWRGLEHEASLPQSSHVRLKGGDVLFRQRALNLALQVVKELDRQWERVRACLSLSLSLSFVLLFSGMFWLGVDKVLDLLG